MRVEVRGVGAVGARLARQLVASPEVESVVLRDPRRRRVDEVVEALVEKAESDHGPVDDDAPTSADVVVLCGPPGTHAAPASALLRSGVPVVSTSDDVAEVESLLALDAEAREREGHVAIGAGFAPGLTDVLAAHAASLFDEVDELHVAKLGTGGPSCARLHHRALGRPSLDWRDGGWSRRPGGSGRELVWFPDPIGPQDCYRAGLSDALLLVPAFGGAARVTARVAANRWDRLTSRLPMLRPPHAEGGPGGVRVELRGRKGQVSDVIVYGSMDRPAVATGAVAARVAVLAGSGALLRHGAAGLAELVEPVAFLHALAERGVRCAVFDGDAQG